MQDNDLKTMASICESNNLAARYMASGRFQEAYRILQKATAETCEALSLIDEPWGYGLVEGPASTTVEDQVNTSVFKSQSNGNHEVTKNLFLLPFYIHNEPRMEHDFLHTKLPAVCAILVFNMAVCCHAFFHKANDYSKRQQALSQAGQLYSESADILSHLHLGGSLGQVFLGICNNMVETSFEFGDLGSVQHWHTLLTEAFGQSGTARYEQTLYQSAFRTLIYFSGYFISARAA